MNPDPADVTTGLFASSISTASGAGSAGDVTIHAHTLSVLGGAAIDVDTSGVGQGGSLTIDAGTVNLLAGGSISAIAFGAGSGGNLNLIASRLTLDDRGDPLPGINETGISADSDSSARGAGPAGDLNIHAGTVRVLAGALITAGTFGPGRGGNVNLNALEVTLKQSHIRADALQGIGGNISVAADATPGLIATGPLADRNVTATGKAGFSGNIQNAPANTDIARSVTGLPASLNSGELTLQPQCGQMLDVSTFLIQGRGATPDEPGFWQIDLDLQPGTAFP